ncbi:gap junction alpha-4 protein [Amia ocellicauda]|uniref:gap junction alpha-4 protein n=1 Tax=Amia ocellicauda TaxID=2972642 RepID=UPI003463BDDF|nr:CXA4 protein [Amia calva]
MSKADWTFLEHFLEEGQEYSTTVGKVWLTVLFLFRVLVLGTAAESAWDDEQSDFTCNTLQPGCESVCYDLSFPISHFRFFVLQVIFVSAPSIFYFGYVAIRASHDRKKELQQEQGQEQGQEPSGVAVQQEEEKAEKGQHKCSQGGKVVLESPKLKGTLLAAYALSIILKVMLEIGFMLGMWYLYGFTIAARQVCHRFPCPQMVDCFVSRPTEKTIFTIYMQVIAAVSVILNIVELFYLLHLAITHKLQKKYQFKEERLMGIAMTSKVCSPAEPCPSYPEKSYLYLPLRNNHSDNQPFHEPCNNYGLLQTGSVDWPAKADPIPDPLSNYSCVGAVMPSPHRSSKSSEKRSRSKSSKSDRSNKGHYI